MSTEVKPQITDEPQQTAFEEPQEDIHQVQQRRGQYIENGDNSEPPRRGQYVAGIDNTESLGAVEIIDSELTTA